ncbi:ras association family member isoform X1 [Tachypleus tridentatus]|uniref:ras association family member isoform X1 n=2 Tax=Tachypleus tridentatus TaxID=6853 RepID=UPI003FD055C4
MWNCHKCGKPVFFAERLISVGYDWHPECLRCEECGKRLRPGQHLEHKGVPYCHIPCYSALFGPALFGHGSRVESHSSFGQVENKQGMCVSRTHLQAKLRVYNNVYEGRSGEIRSRERNGRLILEGILRISWGVSKAIHLKEDHDDRMPVRKRNSFRHSGGNENLSQKMDDLLDLVGSDSFDWLNNTSDKVSCDFSEVLKNLPHKISFQFSNMSNNDEESSSHEIGRVYKTLPAGLMKETKLNCCSGESDGSTESNNLRTDLNDLLLDTELENVPLRRNLKSSRAKIRRRCSINGHFYNRETSVFKPSYGTVTTVWVTSLVTTPEVINMLLDKFKVENSSDDFALFIVRDTGECRQIQDQEYPLLTRVMLGPNEDVAKIFIMNKSQTKEISCEVAQYLNLSEVELKAFIQKFNEEEERGIQRIKKKYEEIQRYIKLRLKELEKFSLG